MSMLTRCLVSLHVQYDYSFIKLNNDHILKSFSNILQSNLIKFAFQSKDTFCKLAQVVQNSYSYQALNHTQNKLVSSLKACSKHTKYFSKGGLFRTFECDTSHLCFFMTQNSFVQLFGKFLRNLKFSLFSLFSQLLSYSRVPNTRGVLINRGWELLKETNKRGGIVINGGGQKFARKGVFTLSKRTLSSTVFERKHSN